MGIVSNELDWYFSDDSNLYSERNDRTKSSHPKLKICLSVVPPEYKLKMLTLNPFTIDFSSIVCRVLLQSNLTKVQSFSFNEMYRMMVLFP